MHTRAKQSNTRIIEESSTTSSSNSSDTEGDDFQRGEDVQRGSQVLTTKEPSFLVRNATNLLWIVYDASKIYLLWVVLHFSASQVYVPICSPFSFWGFIITPILAATPQCKALRWVITTGGSTMETMWVILGVWLCSKISIPYSIWSSPVNKPRVSLAKPHNNRDRARSYDHIHEQSS